MSEHHDGATKQPEGLGSANEKDDWSRNIAALCENAVSVRSLNTWPDWFSKWGWKNQDKGIIKGNISWYTMVLVNTQFWLTGGCQSTFDKRTPTEFLRSPGQTVHRFKLMHCSCFRNKLNKKICISFFQRCVVLQCNSAQDGAHNTRIGRSSLHSVFE